MHSGAETKQLSTCTLVRFYVLLHRFYYQLWRIFSLSLCRMWGSGGGKILSVCEIPPSHGRHGVDTSATVGYRIVSVVYIVSRTRAR